MQISVKQNNGVYILNEDNEFVCAHINKSIDRDDVNDHNWHCHDCDQWAMAIPEGDDEWGHAAYAEPKAWEWL